MSEWTDFRDKIEAAAEAIADPVISKGVTFLKDIEALSVQQGATDLESALETGYTTFSATVGTAEIKLIAGLTAFGSALLGYAITIGKEAVAEVKTAASSTSGSST